MSKLFFVLLGITFFLVTHASTSPATLPHRTQWIEEPVPNANSILVPIGNKGQTISLLELSRINPKDFETLNGKKLGFFGKIRLKLQQKKLRNNINNDGTFKGKALQKMAGKMVDDGKSGFHLGGFALGFFLPFWGVPIAYLINDEHKKARVKWAWIGLGSIAALLIISAAALGGFSGN